MEEVLSYSLIYGDELWHVVLYQWLIDNALTDRLLEVRSVLVFSSYRCMSLAMLIVTQQLQKLG